MKNSIFSLKGKTFLLCLLLPLASCTMLNPSSSNSETPSTSSASSIDSTNNSTAGSEGTSIGSEASETSSEVPVSWETPSEGEFIEGMSLTWPNSLIQSIFTSPARYSLPAFVSTSPFFYQYTTQPVPIISLLTNVGQVDGETQYKHQLETSNWVIHEEYKPMMDFIVAVDPTQQMMVLFSVSEGDMFFEISYYDAELFAELNIQMSLTWPGQAIADYLTTSVTSSVPTFVSNYGYYYMAPSEMVEYFILFTRIDDVSEVSVYTSNLVGLGWSLISEGEPLMYVDANEQITLIIGVESGYLSLIIIPMEDNPDDPDYVTTLTWPGKELDAFLAGSYVQIDIPEFNASEYHHYLDEDELDGQSMTIFAYNASTSLEAYVQLAETAGWNVYPMHENAGTGYYAIDPEFEVFFIIENIFDVFSITIWTYHVSLESYYGDGIMPMTTTTTWPAQEVADFLSDAPSVPIPAFSSDYYQFRQEEDDFGPYLLMFANANNEQAVSNYAMALASANYTVVTNENYGSLTYVSYDADHKVYLYFYYLEGHVTIIIRDYQEVLIGGDPQFPEPDTMIWPSDILAQEFGASLTATIPVLNADMGYQYFADSNDETSYMTLTCMGVGQDPYLYYLTMLENQSWTVQNALGLDGQQFVLPYVAYNADQSLMILMFLDTFGVQMEILTFDPSYLDFLLSSGQNQTSAWPEAEIGTMFSSVTHVIPEFPLEEGQDLSYEVDTQNRKITVTVEGVTNHSLTMYMSVLCNETYIVYMNYDDSYALGYHPSGLVTIYFHYEAGTMVIEIVDYSPFGFAEYYSTHIHETNFTFPSHIIEQVFGLGAAQMIPVYVSTNPYTYFSQWFMFNPTVQIMISSNEYEFSDYYFALYDAGWYMEGLISSGSYTATDPTDTFMIEVTLDSNGLATIIISIIETQPT